MISKKSRKVVAALLIGATVCASGTFAYFNARIDLKNVDGLDQNATKTLNITNGKIVIKGKMAGSEAGDLTSLWGYDVARVSTIELLKADSSSDQKLKNFQDAMVGKVDINQVAPATGYDLSKFDENDYVQVNQSPDILGLSDNMTKTEAINYLTGEIRKEADVVDPTGNAVTNSTPIAEIKTKMTTTPTFTSPKLVSLVADYDYVNSVTATNVRLTRATIGAGVTGAISNARPGDAFALGAVDSVSMETAGIEIDNQSNLTTKIGIRLNSKEIDKVKAQLNSMNANGWKVYVKVTGVSDAASPFKEWKEISASSFTGTEVDDDLVCSVASVRPGQAAPKLQMRVELPLNTTNAYQELATGDGYTATNGTNEFDIANMFEIVATQENNPGWNEDGSTSNPLTDPTSTTTPRPYN